MGAERLAGLIKRVVADYMNNENLSDVSYGTFVSEGLKIDNKLLPIPLDMVDIPGHLREIQGEITFRVSKTDRNAAGGLILSAVPEIESLEVTGLPVSIKTKLAIGDRVTVVQKRGGQRYSIIDKVGD